MVCLVTHPEEGAARFARLLVERRVAACVNQLRATSTYRWQGAVHEDAEVLLVVKTCREELEHLDRILDEHHPYDVPELIALRPEQVGPAYLDWWLGELGEARGDS